MDRDQTMEVLFLQFGFYVEGRGGNLDVFKVINDVVIFVFYKITRVAAKGVSWKVQTWKQQEQLDKLLVAVIPAARMGGRGPLPGGTYGI